MEGLPTNNIKIFNIGNRKEIIIKTSARALESPTTVHKVKKVKWEGEQPTHKKRNYKAIWD